MSDNELQIKQVIHSLFLDWNDEYNEYVQLNGPATPTASFSNKMNQLIRAFEIKQKIYKGLRRIAAIIVIIVTGYLMLFLMNEDVRAFTIQFIRTDFLDGFTSYETVENTPKTTTIGVRFKYITNGFFVSEESSNPGFGHVTYTNSSGKWQEIELDYMENAQKMNNGIDNEHSVRKTGHLKDGTPCDIYKCTKKGFNSFIVWKKNNTLLTLSIHDYLEGWELNELYRIANNVELIQQ